LCNGCAQACNWIPALSGGIALYIGLLVGIVAISNVMEVLRVGSRGTQLIEARIEKAQRMSCHLIGDGPLLPQIENQIKQSGLSDEVLLQGAQPYDEVIEQFSQADVVVLATAPTANGKHEGVPNVLKEAMACGVPVIATASGGIPELVDETCGILVPPRDAAAIADALQLLCGKPELRRRMGLAGRKRIVWEFNLNRSTAMRAELFFRSADGYRSRATPAGTRQAESVLVTQRSA